MMITFNHAAFVGRAIESVLSQVCPFDLELVIGDDQSTDGTLDKLHELKAGSPVPISILERPHKYGIARNWIDTFRSCRGDYIAVLEGDDYWTDSNKLVSQVNVMDQHPHWSMCFHKVLVRWEDAREPDSLFPARPILSELGINDLIYENLIGTCSAMYRSGIISTFPSGSDRLYCMDWMTHMLHSIHGPIGFIDQVMGCYRRHHNGVWSGSTVHRQAIQMMQVFRVMRPLISQAMRSRRPMMFRDVRYAEIFMGQGLRDIAFKHMVEAIKVKPWSPYLWRRLLWTMFGGIEERQSA